MRIGTRGSALALVQSEHVRDLLPGGAREHTIVIIKIQRRHQLHAIAFRVEPAQVEQAQIGAAAATGAENPGADGKRFDILKRNLGENRLIHATSSSTARAAAAMARMTGPP